MAWEIELGPQWETGSEKAWGKAWETVLEIQLVMG